jgi:hypothetical protein
MTPRSALTWGAVDLVDHQEIGPRAVTDLECDADRLVVIAGANRDHGLGSGLHDQVPRLLHRQHISRLQDAAGGQGQRDAAPGGGRDALACPAPFLPGES